MTVISDMFNQTATAFVGDAPVYEDSWLLTRSELDLRIAQAEQDMMVDRIREDYRETSRSRTLGNSASLTAGVA